MTLQKIDTVPSVYDQLLLLPLFQGHSRDELTQILAKIKVDFRTFKPSKPITLEGNPCRNIIFLMEGEVCTERTSLHKDLVFKEYFSQPQAFGLETCFGLRQNFSYTLRAVTEVRTIIVDKQHLVNVLFSYEIFRYNVLNMLCTRIQRQNQILWLSKEENVFKDFALLCKMNFTYPAGRKEIIGGMQSLATTLSRPRLNISKMLNKLNDDDLIILSRRNIEIPHLENILRTI